MAKFNEHVDARRAYLATHPPKVVPVKFFPTADLGTLITEWRTISSDHRIMEIIEIALNGFPKQKPDYTSRDWEDEKYTHILLSPGVEHILHSMSTDQSCELIQCALRKLFNEVTRHVRALTELGFHPPQVFENDVEIMRIFRLADEEEM